MFDLPWSLLILIPLILGILCLMEWRSRRKFFEKWPAIDDDEFLRRCGPDTRTETALAVRRIVSEQLGIPYEHIYPEQHFVNDLDCG